LTTPPDRLKSGSSGLDKLLGGGYERKVITQFYGEPGSGKSTFCVLALASAIEAGDEVIYIDSEGFSMERFRQIAGENATSLGEKVFLYEPVDFSQQTVIIGNVDQVLRNRRVGLLILDSATGLYRTELDKDWESVQQLTKQMVILLGYAKRYNLAVVITNQVFFDRKTSDYTGLGGTGLAHISKGIVKLDRGVPCRTATLMKHRSLPEGSKFRFIMTSDGVQECQVSNDNYKT